MPATRGKAGTEGRRGRGRQMDWWWASLISTPDASRGPSRRASQACRLDRTRTGRHHEAVAQPAATEVVERAARIDKAARAGARIGAATVDQHGRNGVGALQQLGLGHEHWRRLEAILREDRGRRAGWVCARARGLFLRQRLALSGVHRARSFPLTPRPVREECGTLPAVPRRGRGDQGDIQCALCSRGSRHPRCPRVRAW